MRVINHLKNRCLDIHCREIMVALFSWVDREKTTLQNDAGFRNAIELAIPRHLQRLGRDTFALIDSIKIKRDYVATCPVKTLALVASNEQFSYLPDEMPELLRELVGSCKTRDEVEVKVC